MNVPRDFDNPSARRVLAAIVVLLLACAQTAASEVPLADGGRSPDEAHASSIRDALCSGDGRPDVCCPRGGGSSTEVVRVRRGSFTDSEAEQLLAHVEGCERVGTALFSTDADGPKRLLAFYPGVETHTCRSFEAGEAPDLLVCHRTLESDIWKAGFFYTLDLRGGDLRRRQLTIYENNARGCPTETLKTAQPVDWHSWEIEGDPRAPLLTLHFQDRDGTVPGKFDDACEAMEHGNPVFGPLRRRTAYYALRGRRFEYVGARSLVGKGGTPEWIDDRRPRAPICRRQDAVEAVRAHRPELTECYREAFRSEGSLRGALEMKWIVGRNGDVRATRVLEDQLGSAPLASCIASVVESFDLPRPRGADSCSFVYTFDFAAEEES